MISSSLVITAENVPERYRKLLTLERPGNSYIIDPRREVIAGPAERETTLTATESLEHLLAAKAACDVGKHYARPDQFRLLVDDRLVWDMVETSLPTLAREIDLLLEDG